MPYVVVGLLILAAVAWAAVNLAYFVFAAAMTVANTVHGEPIVYLHEQIKGEAEAGTTIRYDVVRLPRASAYADGFRDHRIDIEVRNASRWPVNSITPNCALAFSDGDWTTLTVGASAERKGLDDPGYVSTAVPPGGVLKASLRTATVHHEGRVVRADCTFTIAVPWWFWASEMARTERGS